MSGVQMLMVADGEGDQRLDRWLRKRFPNLTQGAIEKMCRKGELRVDGGRVTSATRVAEGQSVRVPPMPDLDQQAPPPSRIARGDEAMIQAAVGAAYRADEAKMNWGVAPLPLGPDEAEVVTSVVLEADMAGGARG